MTSKGLDQVCTIHTFSSFVLCLFHHPGFLHHPPHLLSGQQDDGTSEEKFFPAVLFFNPCRMGGCIM